jgi:Mlc titration factor MtfA (ptsG expression regulator)
MSTTTIILISAIIVLGVFGLYFIFRKETINHSNFDERWRETLLKDVEFYEHLAPSEKVRFEVDVLKFFSKVRITGVDTIIYDKDRLLVASSAVIPLFGYPGSSFDNISEVLIYKGTFNHQYETKGKYRNILGMVGDGVMNRHMIISQPALVNGYNREHGAHNTGVHEFVHLLDKADGKTDGVPQFVLQSKEVQPWLDVVNGEIEKILAGESIIRPYGARNEAEFFSVASEYFFMKPKILRENHPELYGKLVKIYHQDPAQGLGKVVGR